MKRLVALVVIGLLSSRSPAADGVFGNWMIFPGPNPHVTDLLPDADPQKAFRIGHIIFDYPSQRLANVHNPVKELSELPPVADIVEKAKARRAIDALIQQQLPVPHRFHFEEASVIDYGDAGFVWHVTYALHPRQGGFTGVPFRYRAILDGRGKVISPRLTVFDAYFHSAKDGWTCSILHIPIGPQSIKRDLAAEVIRKRATRELNNLMARAARITPNCSPTRMRYESQEVVPLDHRIWDPPWAAVC